MRKRPGGRIVKLSSGAGIAGLAGSGYYNASKFAVEGLSEALSQEVAPLGVRHYCRACAAFLGRCLAVAKPQISDYNDTGLGPLARDGADRSPVNLPASTPIGRPGVLKRTARRPAAVSDCAEASLLCASGRGLQPCCHGIRGLDQL